MQEHMAEISHEIRTPASAIIGWSEILLIGKYGPLNEKQKEIVTEINKRERYLLGAFNELVHMHRLTSGQLKLHIAEINLGQLLDDAISNTWEHWLMQYESIRSGIIKQDIPSTLPRIWADSSQLQQAITGMLAEAVFAVYNDDGSEIVFTASYDDAWITLQVIISREDPFSHLQNYHLQSNRPRMFFCQSVIEMHGGQVNLEQREESRTEVALTLPIKQLVHG